MGAMTVTTRFAPSPTGRLHVGNIRTALHNALFARRHGGTFILRIDDTDRERSTAEYDQAIRDDLHWLGLTPDRIVRQSERFDLYEREFARLREEGRVYVCYETPEELELRRKVLLGRGLPPVYERKPADAPIPEGREPHWRFRLEHGQPIVWNDLIRGEQKFDPALLKRPGRPARGRQLALPAPERDRRRRLWRHSRRSRRGPCDQQRRTDPDVRSAGARSRPSSRTRLCWSRPKASFQAAGLLRRRAPARGGRRADGLAVAARPDRHFAAGRGGHRPRRACLGTSISLTSVARRRISTPMTSKLLNARLLHRMDFAAVRSGLPEGASADDWLLLRPNLGRLSDFPGLVRRARRRNRAARAWPRRAAAGARRGRHCGTPRLVRRAVANADRVGSRNPPAGRGRELFHPLRLALTGRESGPEMAGLVARMGKERAVRRLEAAG
jgi:glutamyl-tRNA synthetase